MTEPTTKTAPTADRPAKPAGVKGTTFTDAVGRQWTIRLDVNAAKRIKLIAGVDIFELGEGNLLTTLVGNPVGLVDCLYAACKPQTDKAGVDDEGFGEGMAGDAIDAATAAFCEALVAFFPSSRREVVALALAQVKAADAKATAAAKRVLESPELAEMIDAELAALDPIEAARRALATARARADGA